MLKYEAAGNVQLPFKDINPDKWYYSPVVAARENDLIKDQLAAQFDLEGPITRQEMAVILAIVLENKGYKPADKAELQSFTDRENIVQWAAQPVALGTREGLIRGMGGGKFAPLENAHMLYFQMYQNLTHSPRSPRPELAKDGDERRPLFSQSLHLIPFPGTIIVSSLITAIGLWQVMGWYV